MFNNKMTPGEFLMEWLTGKFLEKNSQEILDGYYSNYTECFSYQIKHYSNRLTDVINCIKESSDNLDILDYGSGSGTESLYFSLLGANVFGVDYYEEDLLNVAIQRKHILEEQLGIDLNVNFECKNLIEMEKHNKKYDIIWLNEAFHHIEPREKFLKLLPRLLKSGGKVIISEPNAYNVVNQLFFFKYRGFHTIGKTISDSGEEIIYGDERIIFPILLRRSLQKKGIKCLSERYFRIFPTNKANKIMFYLEKILGRWKFLNIHYVYVGEKK